MDLKTSCPGEGLNSPKQLVEKTAQNSRFFILSLPANAVSKSPFAIEKGLKGILGSPKAVKKLRSGDLLIETLNALQSKLLLLAKTFLGQPIIVSPHRTLNTSRGVISEPDLVNCPESEILEGLSEQGVINVRRITIKRGADILETKHLILTFSQPKLPSSVKAGYLNCHVRPYVPNPLQCFKCQRFGHSKTNVLQLWFNGTCS
ncbi:RNA-directed DNA polymerase from mobile element jockey [Caerostris darwini]|uniref:RNA-directed DNA polymerase from mobile element jockey n=1 Tax=Caerostris darwini TaxID=1538125 RepID=A0AAV4X4V2_9ARAC|nr:RNA-directed DNA polymerase from mobile element jockey [Caerostris darwini]